MNIHNAIRVKFLATSIYSLWPYFLVSIMTTIVYFSFMRILWIECHWNYLIATSIGYCMAILTNFMGNSIFTFKSAAPHLFGQLKKYLFLAGVNYCITLIVAYVMVLYSALSPVMISFVQIVVTSLIGYIGSRYWVFNLNNKLLVEE